MSLLEDLKQIPSSPAAGCKVQNIISQLPPADAEQLSSIMANRFAGAAAIADALTRNGYAVSDNTVRRHRLGRCSCPRVDA